MVDIKLKWLIFLLYLHYNHYFCITCGASPTMHHLRGITCGASPVVHHPWCITPVHHLRCITPDTSPPMHHQWWFTTDVSPPMHHPQCITPNASPGVHHLQCITCAYMKFVADAADIVRGAKIFMWSNIVPHEIVMTRNRMRVAIESRKGMKVKVLK